MSRSSLPQSVADRVSAAFTLVTIIGLVWLIATVPQESGATAAPEHAVAARQVDAATARPTIRRSSRPRNTPPPNSSPHSEK
jgi:hypothetical protein